MRLPPSITPLLLAAAVSTSAAAQIPRPRFNPSPSAGPTATTTVRVSVGNGWGGPSGAGNGSRAGGISIALGAERPIIPRVVGVVEATHWESSNGFSHTTLVTGSAALYPLDGADAYLRAGLGYANGLVHAPAIAQNGSDYSISAPAFQYGAGYDYHITPRTTLGVYSVASNTFGGNAKQNVNRGSGEMSLLSVGATFTVRW